MLYNKSIKILLLSTAALLCNAESVTFKVIAVTGTPSVKIDGVEHQMTLDEYPVYKAKVDVSGFPVKYNYVIDGEAETINPRERNQDDESLNEFFNRSITKLEHPKLPKAYESFEGFKTSRLYDDTFVDTVIVKNVDESTLLENHLDEDFEGVPNCQVIHVNPYKVRTFNNATISVSGQSTRSVPKLSFKIKNLKDDKKKDLYNRSAIKLRAEHMDPSFLRDKIYGDVMNSLGVPTAQNKFARLFINDKPYGLYDLSDSITSGRYLRETFNKGKKFNEVNPLFKVDCDPEGGGYGDLGYYGDDVSNPMYGIYNYKGDDKDTVIGDEVFTQQLLPLLKEIDDYDKGLRKDMSLDSETFLRAMAMEFLAGGFDNYWTKPGNYYMFKDVSKNKWYFHDADFHYSFGVNGAEGPTMMEIPLSQFPINLEGEGIKTQRPPLDYLRKNPEIEKHFHSIFDRLFKTSFNPSSLFPRIDSLGNLIKEDAYWDFTCEKTNPDPTSGRSSTDYTNEDFDGQVFSKGPESEKGNIPLKTYIETRINSLVAQEQDINAPPTEFENDLGFVKTPDFVKDVKGSTSAAIGKYSWNIYTILITLFITLIL